MLDAPKGVKALQLSIFPIMNGLRLPGKLLSLEGAMSAVDLGVGGQVELGESRGVESGNRVRRHYLSRCSCIKATRAGAQGSLVIVGGVGKEQAAMRQRELSKQLESTTSVERGESARTRSEGRDCK